MALSLDFTNMMAGALPRGAGVEMDGILEL